MKKIYLVIIVFLLMILTACHPCEKRPIDDLALQAFAEEYNLSEYYIEWSSWDEAECICEYNEKEACSYVPENQTKKIIEHKDNVVKIVYVPLSGAKCMVLPE